MQQQQDFELLFNLFLRKMSLMVIFSKLMTLVEVKTPDISNLGSTFSVTEAGSDECVGLRRSLQDSDSKLKH